LLNPTPVPEVLSVGLSEWIFCMQRQRKGMTKCRPAASLEFSCETLLVRSYHDCGLNQRGNIRRALWPRTPFTAKRNLHTASYTFKMALSRLRICIRGLVLRNKWGRRRTELFLLGSGRLGGNRQKPSQKQLQVSKRFLATSRSRIPPTGGIHKAERQSAQRKPIPTRNVSSAVFAPSREYF
jgi:hypothetical protein